MRSRQSVPALLLIAVLALLLTAMIGGCGGRDAAPTDAPPPAADVPDPAPAPLADDPEPYPAPAVDATEPEEADQVVVFADARIESAVRQSIANLSGDILIREVERITNLDVTDEGVSDLDGIQFCSNLRRLYLRDNQISDLTPLAELTQLTHLDLRSNQIEDISLLAGLISLTWLQLWGNPLDLTPGSAARQIIEDLEARGVDVSY